ncbi:hypothetical protein [Tardiphaga sp. P5_C7]
MSMNYGVVFPSFWTGATGRALRQDVDAQVVALYLMTSPHANIIGVFRCPIQFIQLETGRPIEGASKGLTKLCELGFCTVDPDTETVWVHEMAHYQIGPELKGADKRIKHVRRFFDDIENAHIKRAFFAKYGAAYQLPEPPVSTEAASPIEGASKPHPSPIEATITITDTITSTPHPSDEGPKPKSKTRAKRKTPVPEGQELDTLREIFLLHAQAKRIPAPMAADECDRFLDHHRKQGSTFADWDAAGRNWLRNTVKFEAERQQTRATSGAPRGGYAKILVDRHMERTSNGTVTFDHDDQQRLPDFSTPGLAAGS